MGHIVVRILLAFALAGSAAACQPAKRAWAEMKLESGAELFQDGKYAEAEALLQEAVNADALTKKRQALAWTIIGLSRDEREDFEGAIDAHDKAIKLDPTFHKAWVNKGIALRLLGKLDEAAECYRKALVLKPDYAEGHASLGVIHLLSGRVDDAIGAFQKAIELDNALAIAHSNLAVAYATAGRFDKAEASLQRAIKRGYKNPDKVRARINALKNDRP